jgi:HEAT repeat protein
LITIAVAAHRRARIAAEVGSVVEPLEGGETSGTYSDLEDVGVRCFHPDADVARDAIERLGGDQRAAAVLVRYARLSRKRAPLRHRAVALLGFCGKNGVEDARRMLGHSRREMRANAAIALGRIGPDAAEAVPELIHTLKDPSMLVRDRAAAALGEMGGAASSALPDLWRVDSDGSVNTAGRAARKIERQVAFSSGSASVSDVIGAFEDRDLNGPSAVKKLGGTSAAVRQLEPYAMGQQTYGSAYSPVVAVELLGHCGREAVPTLLKILKPSAGQTARFWDSGALTMRALDSLGQIGPDAAEAVPIIIPLLGSKAWTVQWHAAGALGDIGPAAKTALPALERLRDHKEPTVKHTAVEAIEAIRAGGVKK